MRPARRFLFASVTATLIAMAHVAQGQPAEAPSRAEVALDAAANAVLKEAAEAARAGDFATCRTKAAGVWDSVKHPTAAGLLGLCEVELGQHLAAAQHLTIALDADDASNPARSQAMTEAFAKAKVRIAIVLVQTSVGGAEVLIDDSIVGKTPHRAFMEPGKHRIQVRLGERRGERDLDVHAGEQRELSIDLPKAGGAGPIAPPPPEDRPIWPALVIGSVGAAGLALGIGFSVGAAGAQSDAEQLAEGILSAGGRCEPVRGGFEGPCDVVLSAKDDVDLFGPLAITGFAVAGAATAGLITYLVWPSGDAEPPAPPVALAPLPGGLFVQWSGAFE